MGRAWLGVLVLAALGCLEGGAEVPGRSIVVGREARRPTLVRSGGSLYVVYQTSKPRSDPKPWAPRLWAVPYEGGEAKKLTDNGAWPVAGEDGGTALVFQDLPSSADLPLVHWYPGILAPLVRVHLETGKPLKQFTDVVDYGFWRGRLYVLTRSAGAPLSDLLVERNDGVSERLGPLQEVKWGSDGDLFMLTPGPDATKNVLARLRRPDERRQVLQKGVTRFRLHPDESCALVNVVLVDDEGVRTENRLVDLVGGDGELPVELPETCAWLGFAPRGRQFLCLDRAAAPDAPENQPALRVLRVYDLNTGEASAFNLDVDQPEAASVTWADSELPQALIQESGRRPAAWVYQGGPNPRVVRLGRRAFSPTFAPDGRSVAYREAEPPAGSEVAEDEPLMVQDLAFAGPPKVASLPRARTLHYWFVQGGRGVLFLSHFGNYKASLHLADVESGERRVILDTIGWSVWPWSTGTVLIYPQLFVADGRVLGVARWSEQDRVGDLVLIDLATKAETVLARSVIDVGVIAPCARCGQLDPGAAVAVAVHERQPSPRDGLWGLRLP